MVLVCDDQPGVLVALDILLKGGGYPARMTAWADIELAVEAVRRGAADFVQKPWDNSRLLASLERTIRQSRGGRTEMEAARLVQERLLPRREYRVCRARFRASFDPAGEVGGDYFDFFELGGERCAFLLADVSGKGVPAALLMANLQALFHAQTRAMLGHPAKLVEHVNDLFFRSTAPEHYATLFYAVYDGAHEELTYVNCGNPPGELKRAGGHVEECGSTGLPLGLFPSARCTERKLPLGRAERIIVCSDGITEADMGDDDKTRVELRIE